MVARCPEPNPHHERLTSEGDSMTTATPDQRHLAALLDGEPGRGEIEVAIAAFEQEASLRDRFERGLLIGQVLRGEAVLPAARTIGARVSAALASEPSVPRRPPRPPRVLPFLDRPAINRAAIDRPAAALAIAASLVAVAILVGPGLLQGPDMVPSTPALTSESAAMGAQPEAGMVERWAIEEPVGSTALDALLVDHRERVSASGLTGFIPYAAVVGQNGLR